ncbi:hypothetical protein [Olavius algarvensis spirochete endosymbiont]|uniref:hypothetical protein n=1 Tax=Olavius algarvensis spirochete endosymbiont TaxID=260710 RepID=UPI0018A80187|nr:hypothetical protein [Olavius algarvensis spirochete endosymbiont]
MKHDLEHLMSCENPNFVFGIMADKWLSYHLIDDILFSYYDYPAMGSQTLACSGL